MARRLMTLLFLGSLSLFLTLATQAASKVKLNRDGKNTSLPNVTAVRFTPHEGPAKIYLLFTEKKPDGVVVADSFGEDSMSVVSWAMDSGSATVKIDFKEGDVENYGFNVYSDGQQYSSGGHNSGGETRGAFKKVNVSADKITGELKVDGSTALSGTFDAPITTVKEAPVVTGAAVGKSPQAAALMGFAKAMSKMDLKAAQTYSAKDVKEEFGKAKEMFGEKGFKEMIKEMFGDPRKLEQSLKSENASMMESGDKSQIRITEKYKNKDGEGSSTSTFTLVKMDGKWKVD